MKGCLATLQDRPRIIKKSNDKGIVQTGAIHFFSVKARMPPFQKIKMYYDPLGRVVKTVNPDKSEQWVIYGIPQTLNVPLDPTSPSTPFRVTTPTPWENYTYDSNDLAPLTNASGSNVNPSHYYTPKSGETDVLGRTVRTTEFFNNGNYNDTISMHYSYDVRGNLLLVKDPYQRTVFTHVYDLRPPQKGDDGKDQPLPPLRTVHIDKGFSTILFDATGKPIVSDDAKGAQALSSYDVISRPVKGWARNKTADAVTLRGFSVYGDATRIASNTFGKTIESYDEAGKVSLTLYDFKGNLLNKQREVVDDSELQTALSSYTNFMIDWDLPPALSSMVFESTMRYDALNRVTELELPEDLEGERKKIIPTYNTAGALEKVDLYSLAGGTINYVENIAYNAKGQRILIAFGNNRMTRYTYNALTFRLVRQRTEGYTKSTVGDVVTYAYTAGTNKQDDKFNYDLIGNIINIFIRGTGCGIDGVTPTNNELDREFIYDPIYRLTYADGRESDTQNKNDFLYEDAPQGTFDPTAVRYYQRNYSYDKLGNIESVIQQDTTGFTRDYVYNSGKNTLQKIVDGSSTLESYTYDACGNTLDTNQNRHYEWNHADQLICYKNQALMSTPTIYAQYDYAGQDRVSKIVRTGSDYERTIYIDGVFEYVSLGTLGVIDYEKNYIHVMDDKSRIAEVRVGDVFPTDIVDSITYILEDQIGSSVTRLSTSGTVIDEEEYYPFGDSSLRTFTFKRYRYVGKQRDGESGLYYYGARYYAAWTCRFISVDPLARDYPFYTPYNYAGNKPINKIDIDGMQEEGKEKAPTQPVQSETHSVKKGDTLWGIAKEHGTTVDALRKANNLDSKNDSKLKIGTELILSLGDKKAEARTKFETLDHMSEINHTLDASWGKVSDGNSLVTEMKVDSFKDLLAASLMQSAIVEVEGELLNKIISHPGMIEVEKNFAREAYLYFQTKGSESFYTDLRSNQFRKTGTLTDSDELFWAIGAANVKIWAEKSADGGIDMEMYLADRFEFAPRSNNKGADNYKAWAETAGYAWHAILGANRGLITTAHWQMHIPPPGKK